MSDGAEDELLVLPARHEVDAAGTPEVGNEGQAQQVFVIRQRFVTDLDARWKHLRRCLHTSWPVELLKPRPCAIENSTCRHNGSIPERHTLELVSVTAALGEFLHACIEADLDTLPHASGVDVPETSRAVHVATTVLVNSSQLAPIFLDKLSRFSIDFRKRLGRQGRETLLDFICIHHVATHVVLDKAVNDTLVVLARLAEHP